MCRAHIYGGFGEYQNRNVDIILTESPRLSTERIILNKLEECIFDFF